MKRTERDVTTLAGVMQYIVVALAGFVLGGWAIPLGFILDLSPLATFLTAAAGGLVGCWAFIFAGERIRARLARSGRSDEETADRHGRVSAFVDRYGARGLGLVGPILPGVTASVAGGLALGLDRWELGRWMSTGIVVLYGLYVLGLWAVIELV